MNKTNIFDKNYRYFGPSLELKGLQKPYAANVKIVLM